MANTTVSPQQDPLGFGIVCPFRRTSAADFDTASGPVLVQSDVGELLGVVPGEIPWRPSLGTNVSRLRQRPNTDALAALARVEVDRALARWEDRAIVQDVAATRPQPDETDLKVAYKVGGTMQTAKLTL